MKGYSSVSLLFRSFWDADLLRSLTDEYKFLHSSPSLSKPSSLGPAFRIVGEYHFSQFCLASYRLCLFAKPGKELRKKLDNYKQLDFEM